MMVKLSTEELNDLWTIEEGTRGEYELAEILIPSSRAPLMVESERDLMKIMDAVAAALDTSAADWHGLDSLDDLFERMQEEYYEP